MRAGARLTCALFAFAVAAQAPALVVEGVRPEDRISLNGRALVLNGAGIRAKLLLKIYVASLYLPRPEKNVRAEFASTPRRIQMNMLLTVSSEDIIDALLDTISDNSCPEELAAVKTETDQLVGLIRPFKEVKEGDAITLDFVDGGTNLGWNGKFEGRIPGEAFNRALTRIWLGDKPVQPDLKDKLLGG